MFAVGALLLIGAMLLSMLSRSMEEPDRNVINEYESELRSA